MRYKVLLAIDNQMAENAFKEKIAKANPDYEVVACVVHKDSAKDYIADNNVDVLVIIEGLNGNQDDFQFAINLKMEYPQLRIVFIAGARTPGDKSLAKLVSYQIFDILAGNRVSIGDMVNRTVNPATWKDASIYLPNTGRDIFSEEELQNTQNVELQNNSVDTTTTEILSDENGMIGGQSLKDRFRQKQSKLQDDTLIGGSEIPQAQPFKLKDGELSNVGNESYASGGADIPPPIVPGRVSKPVESAEVNKLRKQLEDAEKRAKKLEEERNKAMNKNRQMADDYDRLEQELRDLDKSRNVTSKQKVITFYGTVPGVGCTTASLNTAVYLALKGHKVIYIELNDVLPTLSYWFDLDSISSGLEKAFFGIETRNYQDIDDCIVKKEDILALKSDMNDKHMKYPENLHYLFFSTPYIKSGEIVQTNPNTLKDLLLFLLYKEGYDYIILDVYSHCDFHILETSTIFSSMNVFVMTQDVYTIGSSLKMFAALKSNGVEFEFLKDASIKGLNSVNYKNIYLINKYNNNIVLNKPKIKSWLEADKIATIPDNSVDIINSNFRAMPAILTSKNKDFLVAVQKLAEMFK